MAMLKIKRLIEDLENNTNQVLSSVAIASSASYAGTSYKATSAGNAGTTYKATSAGNTGSAAYAGTASVSHWGSSGTGALAGTNAIYATGL